MPLLKFIISVINAQYDCFVLFLENTVNNGRNIRQGVSRPLCLGEGYSTTEFQPYEISNQFTDKTIRSLKPGSHLS